MTNPKHTDTSRSDLVEAMARAIYNDGRGPRVTPFDQLAKGAKHYWYGRAQAAAAVIADALAERDAEIARLRANAKANNDLARMYKAQVDEFRAKYVVASETLDFIAPSLPVLRDMLKRAHMPKGANKAAEMIEAVSAALGSAEG